MHIFKKVGKIIWKIHGTIYKIGVERESLRCTKEGKLSDLPHPKIFGDRMKNNFITTDFGESMLELVTPVCKSTKECYNKLEQITDVVLCELNNQNELLWPYSMPCILPDIEHFHFNNYGDNISEANYEKELYEKYGYKMHCISGIHVNFSIEKSFYNKLRKTNKTLPLNMDDAYFKIMRQFMKKSWILIYLLGATPFKCDSNETSVLSLRNSNAHGFKSKKPLNVDFTNKQAYVSSIYKLLENGEILRPTEVYIPIRAKSRDKHNVLEDLSKQSVDHIEVRLVDINPFDKCGISKNDLDLIVAFLFYCLLSDDTYELNYKEVAENGLTDEQHKILLNTLKVLKKINKDYNLDCDSGLKEAIQRATLDNTRALQVKDFVKEKGLLKSIITLAEKYSDECEEYRYHVRHYPKLEVSTIALIKDAVVNGVDFNVLNENTCLVEFINNNHREFIVQATKTSRDSYIFPIITDDKFVSKQIMKEHNLRISEAVILNKNMDSALQKKIIAKFSNMPVVIKPRNTNCGVGISVFNTVPSKEQLNIAIKYAFKFDNDILLEEFAPGKEYRFYVINGKCLSVVHRRSASVVGDGHSTIKELVDMKNKEYWHSVFRRFVRIDVPVIQFLKMQGYSVDSIPEKDKRVFLRENSNCSTGGESIEVSDIMPDYFKKIAEKASKAFNAKICGVDILINDFNSKDYCIVEINDNPGMGINEWPYEGNGVALGTEVLKLVNLI